MQKRCDRNRKRSKRRAIYCPIHSCYLDSVSQKYPLFADRAEQLRERGIGRKSAQMLVASQTAVPLVGEWLEAFWCKECEDTKWYHVRMRDRMPKGQATRAYNVSPVAPELWQKAVGAIDPEGNPSVGEFTRRHARMIDCNGLKDFKFFNERQ